MSVDDKHVTIPVKRGSKAVGLFLGVLVLVTACGSGAGTHSASSVSTPTPTSSAASEPLAGAAAPHHAPPRKTAAPTHHHPPPRADVAPTGTWHYDVTGSATYDGEDVLGDRDVSFTVSPKQGDRQDSVFSIGSLKITTTQRFRGIVADFDGVRIESPLVDVAYTSPALTGMTSARQAFVGTADEGETLDMDRSDYTTGTVTVDDQDVAAQIPTFTVKSAGSLEFEGTATFWYGPHRLPLRVELTGSGFVLGDPLDLDLQLQLQSVNPS